MENSSQRKSTVDILVEIIDLQQSAKPNPKLAAKQARLRQILANGALPESPSGPADSPLSVKYPIPKPNHITTGPDVTPYNATPTPKLFKLWSVTEFEPDKYVIEWALNSDRIHLDGEEIIDTDHPWYPFARWAAKNPVPHARGLMENDLKKVIAAFDRSENPEWDQLLRLAETGDSAPSE